MSMEFLPEVVVVTCNKCRNKTDDYFSDYATIQMTKSNTPKNMADRPSSERFVGFDLCPKCVDDLRNTIIKWLEEKTK